MGKHAHLVALALAASSTILPGRTSRAQEKDAVTDMARRRFQEGVKFYDQKRFEEARAAFLQAYVLKHHPAVLLNLAQSEVRSGHSLEAARHFSAFLRDSSDATASGRAEAEKGLSSVRSQLGRIQVSVAAGAELLVDGESIGQAPLPDAIDVAPGTHLVEGKLAGHTTTASITVLAGESANATLSFEPDVPVAVAPAPAAPVASANPPPPPTPPETPPAAPPPQESTASPGGEIEAEGRQPFFKWLRHNGVGILGVGFTGIGIGAFAGFEIAAKHASNSADQVASDIRNAGVRNHITGVDVCSPVLSGFEKACSELHDNTSKRDTDRTLAVIGAITAGVGLTVTIAAYFMTSKESSTHAPQAIVTPVVAPQQVGLALTSSF